MNDAQPARPVAGYQGEPGAFSEQAVRALLGEVQTAGYRTFADVVAALESGGIAYAVLPYENSQHGPIAQVRDLIAAHRTLTIAGETAIPVEQCLIAMPDVSIESIDCVASHPVALAQCRKFLLAHRHWRTLESDDTAGSVREMMERSRRSTAAIGPAAAAERYGARLLLRGIQDDADNVTQFWLVVRGN